MVAVLALEAGRTVYYEELVDELWPTQVLKNPRNALQAQATRIRKMLQHCVNGAGQPVELRAAYNGYILDLPRESVDSHRFLDLSTRGLAALPTNPALAVRNLRDGLALWRGPVLLNTHSGERCRGAVAFLRERRMLAFEDLAVARLLLGDYRQAAADLHGLIAAHPVRERLCALLMLTYYRSGCQSDALRIYHRTRRILDEELGVEPGRALLHLYEDILAQDSALDCADVVLTRPEFGFHR
ncbi:BTAD domain-containing putative transcriptional regulator [Nocardia fluminea]|uniref:AfsR/SARP family transcriptional regulator n=1 Tax=Nocardia fluminea TaxID=134984 RepID=UPI0037F1A94D